MRLTEAGRVLVEHTATVMAELEAAQDALSAVLHGDGGRLRFASFPTANAVLMRPTLDVLPMAARAAGFEPQIVFRTDDQTTVRGLLAAGLGVAMVPSLIVSSLPPGVVVLPLDEPALTRTVMVAWPALRPLAAATAMIEALETAVATLA